MLNLMKEIGNGVDMNMRVCDHVDGALFVVDVSHDLVIYIHGCGKC